MTENLKIITGTPEDAEKEVAAYLDSHPSAKILSHSFTFRPGDRLSEKEEEDTAALPEESKSKKKAKDNAKKAAVAITPEGAESGPGEVGETPPVIDSDAPWPVAATLRTVEYGPPTPFVSVIVAVVY